MSCNTNNLAIRERVEKSNHILKYADESRKAEMHTDICITGRSKSFRAHRLILSCYSAYFKKMFQTEMEEKHAHTVSIKSVDDTSLGLLIEFIYTGKISINQENVFDLLAASDYLQIDEAKQFCFDFLPNVISVSSCFKVLKTANLYQNNSLQNKTFQFITNNFVEILLTNDYKRQPKEYLFDLLSQLQSNYFDESLVYDVIIAWVKHRESRKDEFAELFQRLDLSKFSSSHLAETVSTENLVIENHLCSTLVMKTLAMKLQERVSNKVSKILSLGGCHTRNKVFVVYKYEKNVCRELSQDVYAHCSLQLDDFVYCIGGWNESSAINTVCRMKLLEANTPQWEEVTSMNVGRAWFGAAIYKNGIAVAGGFSGVILKSAEFYNPLLNQWTPLPSINQERSGHAVVACNNCLFSLGGYCDKCLSSVEMLSDLDGKWQDVQPMQTPRKEFAAVNCVDTIYAIGGENDQHEPTKSVEKYDCKLNRWMFVKEMNVERRGHSACVMQDKIFVVGGQNAKSEFVSEIECYDLSNNEWSIFKKVNEKLHRHSIIAI